MRIVLVAVWLLALCLPVSAAETVQRSGAGFSGGRSHWIPAFAGMTIVAAAGSIFIVQRQFFEAA